MNKIYEQHEIKSVQDAIEILDLIEKDKDFTSSLKKDIITKFPFAIWFRGHSNAEGYKLDPSIFRDFNNQSNNRYQDETNIYIHSTLRLPNHQKTYSSSFDWLCLMQHYDTPTRILDWSESVLVALYFAVKNSHKNSGNAEIVVLNARTLNKEVRDKYSICRPDSFDVIIRARMAQERLKVRVLSATDVTTTIQAQNIQDSATIDSVLAKPVAVFPNRWNERMVFQSSVFTIHGGKKYSYEDTTKIEERLPEATTLEDINRDRIERGEEPILKYYKIPHQDKAIIEETLFRLGIHEGSLFPEMDHQSAYLRKQWSY
jgi:hypothetical protein